MKLLKIVLIAFVTVGIYSFTTNPISKKEEVNYKKELLNSTTCVTITFQNGLDESGKERARSCFQMTKGIHLLSLISSNNQTETWIYTNLEPGTLGSNRPDTDGSFDKDDKCTKKGYGIIAFSFGNDCIDLGF